MNVQAFTPGQTVSVAPSGASASATFTTGINSQSCLVQNTGSAIAFIKFSVGAATATTSDFPLPAGAIVVLDKGNADTFSAYSAGTTVYATAGEGQ